MSEDRTGLLLAPKRKRTRRTLAHFAVVARVDRSQPTPATVTIDRSRSLVTIRRVRARTAWRIPLAALVELGMARIMRDQAQRQLGVAG